MKLKSDFGVTALLALIAVLGSVTAGCYLVFSGKGIEAGMAFLSNIALVGMGYYVGYKNGQQPPGPPSPPAGSAPGGTLP